MEATEHLDPRTIANGLVEIEPGYYVAGAEGSVSYPEQAHRVCLGLEEASYWFQHRNTCIAAAVQRFPPGGPVLDLGGGNGYVSLGLRQAGCETFMLEPGRDGARSAQARGLRPVIEATFEAARFRRASLPAIGMFDVLEHIEDADGFLASVVTVLQPGGRLYLTVPAHRALWSSEDVAAGHFRRYGKRSLERSLTAAGLEAEFLTYLFWFLPAPIAVFRALTWRVGLRRGDKALSRTGEFVAPHASVDRALRRLLAIEVSRIRRGSSVPFGSSILAVARRPLPDDARTAASPRVTGT